MLSSFNNLFTTNNCNLITMLFVYCNCMEVILVTKNLILNNNLIQNLKNENINVLTIENLRDVSIKLLYRKFDMVIIDSNLSNEERDNIYELMKFSPGTKITILHSATLAKRQNGQISYEADINYCYLIPYFNNTNIGSFIRWVNKESNFNEEKEILQYDDLYLNRKQHLVKRGDKIINLRKKEFYILEFFMMHPEMVVKRETLLYNIWDMDTLIVYNTIDSHVHNLREKLRISNKTSLIHAVRGIGYRFSSYE